MINIRKFLVGIGLIPNSSSQITQQGELEVLSSDGSLHWHDGSATHQVVGRDTTDTLTNKTISGSSNTLTNLPSSALTGQVSVANGGTGSNLSATGGTSQVLKQTTVGGAVTVAQLAASDLSNGTTGSGAVVLATSPSLTTPALGVASATTINKVTITAPATGSTLTIADGKTLTASNTLTLAGTDGSTLNIGSGGTLVASAFTDTTNASNISSGILAVAHGGTGDSTLTTNGMLYGNGTSAVGITAAGSQYQVFQAGASGVPAVGALHLDQSAAVTGVLPSGNVGLGRTINAQTGTTYTFALADGSSAGGSPLVTASNASPQTYTVPPNSSVAFPVGTQIDIVQVGAGKVTLAQGAGVTINSQSSNKSIAAQYVGVSLVKTATDTWLLLGNLIA